MDFIGYDNIVLPKVLKMKANDKIATQTIHFKYSSLKTEFLIQLWSSVLALVAHSWFSCAMRDY